MRFSLKSSKPGYSLAELLIAISIIGILTAVAVPRFSKVRDRAALANSTTRLTRALFAARQPTNLYPIPCTVRMSSAPSFWRSEATCTSTVRVTGVAS